jgi:diadenosine tetraphosphate (Ap4A) HIT family hydrolase
MRTLVHERVEKARRGENVYVVCRLASGWLSIGDHQFLPGYCVLAPDPVVESINALTGAERAQFLLDMVAVGDALLAVTDAWRINYAIAGNAEPALHAHIRPRYLSEVEERRHGPAERYENALLASVPFDLERDRPLMDNIRRELERVGACRG